MVFIETNIIILKKYKLEFEGRTSCLGFEINHIFYLLSFISNMELKLKIITSRAN
jgi:hypothetical protein